MLLVTRPRQTSDTVQILREAREVHHGLNLIREVYIIVQFLLVHVLYVRRDPDTGPHRLIAKVPTIRDLVKGNCTTLIDKVHFTFAGGFDENIIALQQA